MFEMGAKLDEETVKTNELTKNEHQLVFTYEKR